MCEWKSTLVCWMKFKHKLWRPWITEPQSNIDAVSALSEAHYIIYCEKISLSTQWIPLLQRANIHTSFAVAFYITQKTSVLIEGDLKLLNPGQVSFLTCWEPVPDQSPSRYDLAQSHCPVPDMHTKAVPSPRTWLGYIQYMPLFPFLKDAQSKPSHARPDSK